MINAQFTRFSSQAESWYGWPVESWFDRQVDIRSGGKVDFLQYGRSGYQTGSQAGCSEVGAGGYLCGGAPIRKIIVQGHAEYAAHGEDIVCAAASATIYTAAGALTALCGAPENCAKEHGGYFELTAPDLKNRDAVYRAIIIMETAYIGFKQIEASYPDYLKVAERVD